MAVVECSKIFSHLLLYGVFFLQLVPGCSACFSYCWYSSWWLWFGVAWIFVIGIGICIGIYRRYKMRKMQINQRGTQIQVQQHSNHMRQCPPNYGPPQGMLNKPPAYGEDNYQSGQPPPYPGPSTAYGNYYPSPVGTHYNYPPPEGAHNYPPPEGGHNYPPPEGGHNYPPPEGGHNYPPPEGGHSYPPVEGSHNSYPPPSQDSYSSPPPAYNSNEAQPSAPLQLAQPSSQQEQTRDGNASSSVYPPPSSDIRY